MQTIHHRAEVAWRAQSARPRSSAGVSLTELLVVVAILLVILAMAVPRMMASRQSAQQVAAVALLKKLHAAQELHYIVHGQYAATFAELDSFTADLRHMPAQPEFLRVSLPPQGTILPTMAFLLLPSPAPGADQSYAGSSPNRPKGEDKSDSGGSAPMANPSSSGSSNPTSGGSGGNSGSDPSQGSSEDSSSSSGGGSAASDGAGSGPSGSGAQVDRLTWQGYEFRLERPSAHEWRCFATPLQREASSNHYYADQTGAIRREFGRAASSSSAPL